MKNILIVEENFDFAKKLENVISPFFNVSIAGGINESSSLLVKRDFDVVVANINTEKGEGLKVINLINQFKNNKIKTIGYAGDFDEELTKKMKKLKINNYIFTPRTEIEHKNLIATIQTLANTNIDLLKNENMIIDILTNLGTPKNILGYTYLKEAIEKTSSNIWYKKGLTKKLYPEIALNHQTTFTNVIRQMGYALDITFQNRNEHISKLFPYIDDYANKRPVPSEFIATIAEFVTYENNKVLIKKQ